MLPKMVARSTNLLPFAPLLPTWPCTWMLWKGPPCIWEKLLVMCSMPFCRLARAVDVMPAGCCCLAPTAAVGVAGALDIPPLPLVAVLLGPVAALVAGGSK